MAWRDQLFASGKPLVAPVPGMEGVFVRRLTPGQRLHFAGMLDEVKASETKDPKEHEAQTARWSWEYFKATVTDETGTESLTDADEPEVRAKFDAIKFDDILTAASALNRPPDRARAAEMGKDSTSHTSGISSSGSQATSAG